MGKRKIIWSHGAETEIKDILYFYTERNGSRRFSVRLLKEIKNSLNLLIKHPYLGRISDNYKTRILVKEYVSVFYEITDTRIEIVSVWDNRKDPKDRSDSSKA